MVSANSPCLDLEPAVKSLDLFLVPDQFTHLLWLVFVDPESEVTIITGCLCRRRIRGGGSTRSLDWHGLLFHCRSLDDRLLFSCHRGKGLVELGLFLDPSCRVKVRVKDTIFGEVSKRVHLNLSGGGKVRKLPSCFSIYNCSGSFGGVLGLWFRCAIGGITW